MKLLFITQVVDRNDAVLGAYHGWLVALAPQFEKITVICLKEGEHSLPENVRVFSLGKEHGRVSRSHYAWRFLKIIWRQRGAYDAVFVHMNQEYILIAGWLWKLLGKKIYLWRNHYAGSFLTDVAALFCASVFCTSKYSYTAHYKKTVFMPVGIDAEVFKTVPRVVRKPHSILFLARMSASKHPELLIEALGLLKIRGIECTAALYGSPLAEDEAFYASLQTRVRDLHLDSCVTFHAGVPNIQTPTVYSRFEIFVNCSPSGMYDKTIFEAAACGVLPLAASRDWALVADSRLSFTEGEAEDLADKLWGLLSLPPAQAAVLREGLWTAVEHNTLSTLTHQMTARIKQENSLLPHKQRVVLFQNGSIGDFLMAVYLSQELWKSGQFASIDIIVPRGASFLRGFLTSYPYISVLEISMVRPRSALRILRGRKVAILHPTVGRIPLQVKIFAWFTTCGRGSELIGFKDAGPLCGLYSKTLVYDTSKPYLETMHDIARALLVSVDSSAPRLEFPGNQKVLEKFNLNNKPYIVFHPGASNPKRMFSVVDAVQVIDHLQVSFPDFSVVLSGGPEERTRLVEIRDAAKEKEKIIIAAGCPAQELVALLQNAKLFIGTDTGTTHLACFLGTKVLCVAHHGTANWLPFYAPQARVLYRFTEDTEAHEGEAYLRAHINGRLKPFGEVPVREVLANMLNML